jgi:hypothetical protein
MNLVRSLLVVAVTLAACGGGRVLPDGAPPDESGNPDVAGMPPPPALGAQIARAGRPAISTILIGVFSAPALQQDQKDAYNHAPDPATWKTTMLSNNLTLEVHLETNLAAFDAIDSPTIPMACGNALAYAPPVSPASYLGTADLFADDQLYVDTSMSTCSVYLALELEQASAGEFPHRTCGGRTLTYDVIDVTYSVLASGTDGLDQASGFSPKIHGSLSAHPDVTTTFPFLGPPHPP